MEPIACLGNWESRMFKINFLRYKDDKLYMRALGYNAIYKKCWISETKKWRFQTMKKCKDSSIKKFKTMTYLTELIDLFSWILNMI